MAVAPVQVLPRLANCLGPMPVEPTAILQKRQLINASSTTIQLNISIPQQMGWLSQFID
jgi:hypothetical protein